jgi:hypothetical protein
MHTEIQGFIRSEGRFYIPVSVVIATVRVAYWPLRLAGLVAAWRDTDAEPLPMLPWPDDLFDDVASEPWFH